jgi:hypothetical protein
MTDLQTFDCQQGTPEWYACRLGIPTASEFATVLAKGKGGGESKTRRTYLLKLVGERLTGEPMWAYSNEHMERGKVMEDEARDLYAMLKDCEPTRVGFLRRGDVGASPDSLIGEDGLLEIKTKLPHIHLDVLIAHELPSEHRAQIQGQLWISGREWVDFVSYWPGLKPFVLRVYRDEDYIKGLQVAVDRFLAEMAETIELVSRYRAA